MFFPSYQRIVALSIGSLLLFFTACSPDPLPESVSLDAELTDLLVAASPTGDLAGFQLPNPDDLANIPQDPRNPLTPEKIKLGQLLYHETGLAIAPKQEIGRMTYSCASCHFAEAGFQAGRVQGIGEGGLGIGLRGEGRIHDAAYIIDSIDVQPIRTPTTLNSAYQENMLWNGQFGATGVNVGTEEEWTPYTPKAVNHLGYEGLETQAIAGLTVHRLNIDDALLEQGNYRAMFDAAFANVPTTERYTREYVGLAIAAYERTLMATDAPFQKWLRGDNGAMTEVEKQGAMLFFDKAECGTCHTGPALNSMAFYALGMKDLHENAEEIFQVKSEHDKGRGGFTGRQDEWYQFKVPQLYNLEDSPFLGHGGTFRNIRDVVAYKNIARPEKDNLPFVRLAKEFHPLQLTETEIDDITAFLSSALYDPNLKRYEPEALPSGLCFPNNDPMSKDDMGCD
ncbi:MAG: cytochrome-c peroxidase [Saprospiraceae bacterium]